MRIYILTAAGLSAALAFAQGRADIPVIAPPIAAEVAEPLIMPANPERQSSWIDQIEQIDQAGSPVRPDPRDIAISPSAPEIREYIAALTNRMLSAGEWRDGVRMLCEPDVERIERRMHEMDIPRHEELLRAFAAQWRARYGAEFDLKTQRTVMAEYVVLRGQRAIDEAIIVSGQLGDEARPVRPEQERHATVVVPSSPRRQQPGMILQIQNETPGASDWRLNTPDTLNSRRLQQNLEERLGQLIEQQVPWPADPREAYRLVSYHVLASLNDQPLERPRESQPAAPRPPLEPDNPSLDS